MARCAYLPEIFCVTRRSSSLLVIPSTPVRNIKATNISFSMMKTKVFEELKFQQYTNVT